MLQDLKKALRRTPFAPLAASLYSLGLPPARRDAMLRNLRYDRQTVAVMRRVLGAESSCIDVGAHEGEILRHMVALAPQGQHHAFEPIPRFATALRAAFPGVAVHEAACGERAGEAAFVVVENAPAYSGLRERRYDRPDPVLSRIRVQVARIDDVVSAPIALIKLDVEGGEYHALAGARRTIGQGRPIVIFEAGAPSSGSYGVGPTHFTAFFSALGYRLSTMERWLAARPPFDEAGFAANWYRSGHGGGDYYFIAYPR